jgi:hypothetical protein
MMIGLSVNSIVACLIRDARGRQGFGRYVKPPAGTGAPLLCIDVWLSRTALGGERLSWELNGERTSEQQARTAIENARG